MADTKVSDYTRATTWSGAELLYLVANGLDRALSLTTLFASVPVLAKFAGLFGWAGTHQTIPNSGTVSVTTTITRLTNDQASTATLPAGSFDGQLKILILTSGSATTTLAGTIGNGSIALTKAGDSAMLLWTQSAWWFIGGSATVT